MDYKDWWRLTYYQLSCLTMVKSLDFDRIKKGVLVEAIKNEIEQELIHRLGDGISR
jgi:hypothetical protein